MKQLSKAKKTTDERVAFWPPDYISRQADLIMPNLAWLLPMALRPELRFAMVEEKGGHYNGKK